MIGRIGELRILQALIIMSIYLYLFFCIQKRYVVNKFFLISIVLIIFTTNVIGMDSITYREMFMNSKFKNFELFFKYSYTFFRKFKNFYMLNLFLGIFYMYFFDKIITLSKRRYKRMYFLLIGLFFINGLLNVTRASFAMCIYLYILLMRKEKLITLPLLFHYSSIVLIIGKIFNKIKFDRKKLLITLLCILLLKDIVLVGVFEIAGMILNKNTTFYLKLYGYLFIRDKLEFYNLLHGAMRIILFCIEPIITFIVIWIALKKDNFKKLSRFDKEILTINIIVFLFGINFIFLGKWIFGSRIIVMCSLNNIFLIDKLFKNLFYIGIAGIFINLFYILYTMRIFAPGSAFYIL